MPDAPINGRKQLNVMVDAVMHQRLKVLAATQGRTLRELVEQCIRRGMADCAHQRARAPVDGEMKST